MAGDHFKADMQDLQDSGTAAKHAATTVRAHVGAGHLRDAGTALLGSASNGSLHEMATHWESWAKSWTTSMTNYGESLHKAKKDYEAHDDRYSSDFKNVQSGVDGAGGGKSSSSGPDPMTYVAP